MNEIELSQKEIIQEIDRLRKKAISIGHEKSTLLTIAQESFILGSDTHLNSLRPEVREQLGLELDHITRHLPIIRDDYTNKKNAYLSLGKSYAAISFLIDLVDEKISLLDVLLLQEILMNNGSFRDSDVYLTRSNGSELLYPSAKIKEKVQEIFKWYEEASRNPQISHIVVAILFHYKLVSVHPFLDGNGRISRMFLNLILLKVEIFPISLPDEKRKEYYETLFLADHGKFEPLIDFFGIIISEKLNQYLLVAKELENLESNKTLLVLTEDGNTHMIEELLKIHGIDKAIAHVESYDGKDNLASAIFFAKKLKSKSTNLKHILIHRDRDNDSPQQIKQNIEKRLRSYGIENITTVLITKHYDIESYFLNEDHIHSLFPSITKNRIIQLVAEATNKASEISKSKLRIAYSDKGQYANIEDPQLKAFKINQLYESNPEKYRYGKNVLKELEQLIKEELKIDNNITLAQYSEYVKINEIEKCKTAIQSI